jgi:uncharacterized protein
MKRRDFLKGAVVGAGLLGSGMVSGRAKADNHFGKKKHGVDFYRIDSYCHFAPLDYITELENLNLPIAPPNGQRAQIEKTPSLWDVNERLHLMDECEIDVSILMPNPFIESAVNVYKDPGKALTAAKYINDEIANIVSKYPKRFKQVAILPTNLPSTPDNVSIMLSEFERAVGNGAVGGCFIVSPTMKPPDHPDYMALYGKAVDLDVPLWIHPNRSITSPDYTSDVPPLSKYYLWLLLDWLLDSSVAMARIVFANVFGLYPKVKIIIHHKGALVPLFQNRLTYILYDQINLPTGIPAGVQKPYIDQFKKFYVDTVFSGNESFETEIVQIAYDFFGPDHVLFGTDASYSTNDGKDGILNARYSVEDLQVTKKELENIFSNNILKIIPH